MDLVVDELSLDLSTRESTSCARASTIKKVYFSNRKQTFQNKLFKYVVDIEVCVCLRVCVCLITCGSLLPRFYIHVCMKNKRTWSTALLIPLCFCFRVRATWLRVHIWARHSSHSAGGWDSHKSWWDSDPSGRRCLDLNLSSTPAQVLWFATSALICVRKSTALRSRLALNKGL